MEDLFVETDRYAIAFFNLPLFPDRGGEGKGNSMGLILEARSPLPFYRYKSVTWVPRYSRSSLSLLS